MKKFLLCLLLGFSVVFANAQQIDAQTGNIVYTTLNPPPPGTPHSWNGFAVVNTGGGGLTGGNVPAYNPNTGTFVFGYMQGTVNYSTSINYALANAGTGLQVNGFKYSWEYFNQDYSRGTLSGNISLTNNTGQPLQNYYFNMPQTTEGWTKMSGIKNFPVQYPLAGLGNLNVSFTGQDDRFWAGYWGPQIRDIDVKLLYSIPVPKFSSWQKLTDENGTFTLSNAGIVRYGAEGTFIYQSYQAGTYECSNGAWGKDPIGGVYKSCSLGTNTTSTPLPTTNTNNVTTTTTNSIIAAASEPLPPTTTTTTTTTSSTNTGVDPVSTTTASTTSSGPSSTSTSTASTSVASTATTTTASVTPITTVASAPSGGGRTVDGTSIGLSIVARNQQREQSIAMQASQTAIATAEQASQQTQQEALSVASQAVANSFVMATAGSKSNTVSSEVKTTITNTDTTTQSNQSSTAALSLFASPTVSQNTQRQTENNQNNIVEVAVNTTQTNRTGQSNQQSTVSDTSSRPILLQPNMGSNNNEVEIKPPVMVATVRTTDTTNNVTQSTQETVTQQTQQTFTLLPPQTVVAVQQTTMQKPTVDVKQEATVNLLQQETPMFQQPTIYSLLPPQQPIQQTIQQNVASASVQPMQLSLFASQPTIASVSENNTNDSQKMLLDRSSPLFQTLDNKVAETQNNTLTQTGPTVNRNAQNNEAAAGVDINRMALAPAGYNEYLNFTLRDAAFYAPKEIYKNQKTVDNVRVLRQLSSDRLHQEMVEQQYRR